MYLREDMRGLITSFLTAARSRNTPQLVDFNHNSTASAVLDELK